MSDEMMAIIAGALCGISVGSLIDCVIYALIPQVHEENDPRGPIRGTFIIENPDQKRLGNGR